MTSFLGKSKEQAITRSGCNLFFHQLKRSDKAASISQNFTENSTALRILQMGNGMPGGSKFDGRPLGASVKETDENGP